MTGWIKESFDFYGLQRIMFKLIDAVEIFSGFSQAELVELLSGSEKCTFQANETVLTEGSPGNFMYILIEGEVDIAKKLDNDSSKVLARLSAGDCFGEMALVDNNVRSASVVTAAPCVLIRLGESCIGKNPMASTKLYRNIAHVLSMRLRDTNAMISLTLPDKQ